MGTEYYIIRPRDKKRMCLGKGSWYQLENMPINLSMENKYTSWREVLLDIIDAGCYTEEDTMLFLSTLAGSIWDFIEGEDIFIISDTNDAFLDVSEASGYVDDEEHDIYTIASEIYGEN